MGATSIHVQAVKPGSEIHNFREKDALKAKIKALEGENELLSDRLGKAILEKERNGTKVFKAENDKEYYRQQMDNARTPVTD